MKHAQFDYVNQFHCLAGDCPDTCCKDWQIILDEDALARYRAMPGPLGEQVRAALVTENGETRFREEGGRCVLLRDDGLCPIQAAYGAEALCRTCYTHPRFTEEYGQTAELTLRGGARQTLTQDDLPGDCLPLTGPNAKYTVAADLQGEDGAVYHAQYVFIFRTDDSEA